MVEDEWLTAAMAEDSVVADLLVRLKQSQAASPSKSPRPMKLPFNWGVRQPRSRTAAAMAAVVVRCGDVVLQRNNKDVDSTRCSPTTPLSWSGGASPSATLDGYEASSRHATLLHVASRFKVLDSFSPLVSFSVSSVSDFCSFVSYIGCVSVFFSPRFLKS